MSNTIFITANWTTGALSQQTISMQYDNNRYAVQFIGYPEGDGTEELDLYLLVWMSTAPGQKPGEITPIQLNSDQWYISNYFTQQVQVIKFQLCVLNEAGTYEAHSPIFSGRIGDSLEHNGTSHDIDVSTLFDAYREYVEELIIGAGAVIIDAVPTQGSNNAVSSGGVYAVTADLDARVEDLEQGGTGGLSMTAVSLLNTILTEAVYGSDQTANIALLQKELSNIPPVSISAILDGTALAGQSYSELSFIVTATFDDESTQVVDNYTIVTTGTVTAGSNTVTIRYRGVTTTCTFTAEQVITYTITYNLTNVASSSDVSVVRENAYYNTVLSVAADCTLGNVTVTMGGVDVTSTVYSNLEILITQVTGNVVITASATEITYMDDLLPTRNGGFSNVYGYPNGSTEDAIVIGGGYNYTPFVSEYPAQNECTIHWTIKNVSDANIQLNGCGFGNIDSNDVYGTSSAVVKAFYCVKSDNSAHTLTPGAELEGDVVIKSGMQLCFVCNYADFSKFEVKLAGNYTPDTFSGYTEINPIRENTQEYGSYRITAYYKDSGGELIANKGGTPRKIDVNLEAGTYDMYCSIQADEITNDIRNANFIVGGMDANTDTAVYYAGGTNLGLNAALWSHFTFTLANNGMTLVAVNDYINYINNVNAKIRFMYKKVVQ